VIPVVSRPDVTALKNKLVVDLSGWDSNTWEIASWHMEG
jgi:peptide/nickel transport system substrate-binding protein